MFSKSAIAAKLDAEIISVLEEMESTDKSDEKYANLVERLTKLHKLKIDQRFKPVSVDQALVVAANIFGILWLARYERENVIKAPQAMKFVMKPR